jgi:pyridoxine 5-phosphate synthase
MPIALSVNVNKVALLRNARGRDVPNLLDAVDTCIAAGCQGITVHPRRDQRHVRFDDLPVVAEHLRAHHPGVELNIECEVHPPILERVHRVRPDQCTLVPVTPGEITSDHGWDLPREQERLVPVIRDLQAEGIRTSLFVDPAPDGMAAAALTGADRVEIYTGPYAWAWGSPTQSRETEAVAACVRAARAAGLGVNAGHDLDATNLVGLADLPIDEVSIGHWVITRALWVGLPAAVGELLTALGHAPGPGA